MICRNKCFGTCNLQKEKNTKREINEKPKKRKGKEWKESFEKKNKYKMKENIMKRNETTKLTTKWKDNIAKE